MDHLFIYDFLRVLHIYADIHKYKAKMDNTYHRARSGSPNYHMIKFMHFSYHYLIIR